MVEGIDPQLLYEVEEQVAQRQGLTSYECPCKCCHGAKQQTSHHNQETPTSTWPRSFLSMAYHIYIFP